MSDILAQSLAVAATNTANVAVTSANSAAAAAQTALGTITPIVLGNVSGVLSGISFTTNGRYQITATGNLFLPNWTSVTPGVQIDLFITQGGSGGYGLTFDSNYIVPPGANLSGVLGAIDIVSIAVQSSGPAIVRISSGVILSQPGNTTLTDTFVVPPLFGNVTVTVANGSQFNNGTCLLLNSSPPMYGLVTSGGGTNTLTLQNLYSSGTYGQSASVNSTLIVSGVPGINAYTSLTADWNTGYQGTTSNISVQNTTQFPTGSYAIVSVGANLSVLVQILYVVSSTSLTVRNLSPNTPLSVQSGTLLVQTGIPGTEWTTGASNPTTPYYGSYGDLYLNTTSGNIFRWTAGSDNDYWASVGNIKGPQGAIGPGATTTTAFASITGTTSLSVSNGVAFPNGSYLFATDGANSIQGQVASGGGTSSLVVSVNNSTGVGLNSGATVTFSGIIGPTGPQGLPGGAGALRPGTISNYTTNSTALSFTAYRMPDSTGVTSISAGAITNKSINSNWTAGSNSGLLDTGTAVVGATYHIYLICKSDGTGGDYIASASASGPVLPNSYIGGYYVRIASLPITTGKQFVNFTHRMGNIFYLATPSHDLNLTATATTVQSVTLGVPTGIRVFPYCRLNGSAVYTTLSSPDEPCISVGSFNQNGGYGFDINTSASSSSRRMLTNISGQINYVSGSVGTLSCFTLGWEDPGIMWGY